MNNEKISPLTEGVYYILISLYKPLHGYGIMQNVKSLTNGRVNIGAGTLYGALNTLLQKGFIIECKADLSRKEYIITDEGKQAVLNETLRLKELYDNGRKVLDENYEQ